LLIAVESTTEARRASDVGKQEKASKSEGWEALNKTLKAIDLAALSFPSDGLNWKLDGN
jgi:hypothetical protein